MSISNETVKITYTGDTSTTVFAIPFDIVASDSTEVKVYLRDETDPNAITETLQTISTHYTLTGASPPGVPFATDVTMVSPPSATEKLVIIRQLALTQPTTINTSGPLPVVALEQAYDRLVAQVQQMHELHTRSPKLPISEQIVADLITNEPKNNAIFKMTSDNTGVELQTIEEIMNNTETESKATIADSQSPAANVTDFTLDAAEYTSTMYFVEVRRNSGSVMSNGLLMLQYVGGAWAVEEIIFAGDDHGLTFSVTEAGGVAQLQYESDASGVGTIKWRGVTFSV